MQKYELYNNHCMSSENIVCLLASELVTLYDMIHVVVHLFLFVLSTTLKYIFYPIIIGKLCYIKFNLAYLLSQPCIVCYH